MTKIYICITICIMFLTGCAYKPTNTDLCVKDSPAGAPIHEHCAFSIKGNDFGVGTDPKTGVVSNYTQYGVNITAEQYEASALRISPWSWGQIKKDWLNYCHAHKNACDYSSEVKTVTGIENRLGIDRTIVPEWNDSMLDFQDQGSDQE